MRLRSHSNLHKTLSFAVIHLAIGVALGWLFTGAFILGSLLAFVEPAVNTGASHWLEKVRWNGSARARTLKQGGVMAGTHLVVAMGVGYALSGSWMAASAYAILEPLANAVAHHFFDRWWHAVPEARPTAA
ncbi:DUF2061 domain-containing protein [Ramlibacter sp. G-1-2-2]|uniref:DUF2061 domain-containing protein n=1 Tax=Ramlibacter agri TaxID=2728837 RepID=A0A848HID2_9BURK|nr:DUF2061 domain-containing protein [Ramlibacter agri]NML48273.1 DUF2061 domain-containing protein [Ramlibacter agri]